MWAKDRDFSAAGWPTIQKSGLSMTTSAFPDAYDALVTVTVLDKCKYPLSTPELDARDQKPRQLTRSIQLK